MKLTKTLVNTFTLARILNFESDDFFLKEAIKTANFLGKRNSQIALI